VRQRAVPVERLRRRHELAIDGVSRFGVYVRRGDEGSSSKEDTMKYLLQIFPDPATAEFARVSCA
jgi:hypothetical protein